MATEKGQIQEMFNRSLAWATGCLVVQWLLGEEEGDLAGKSNDFCFGHIVFRGSGNHQGGVCHQLVNWSPGRGRGHLLPLTSPAPLPF